MYREVKSRINTGLKINKDMKEKTNKIIEINGLEEENINGIEDTD
jgi:hypothetical protein